MADLVFPGKIAGGPLNAGAIPKSYDMQVYRGDFVELSVTLKDDAGAVINLTGMTAQAVLKKTYTSPSNETFTFTCSIPNAAAGVVRIFLPSTISAQLEPGDYIWDFQVVNTEGNARTYLAGDVVVYPDVTTGV